MNCDGAGERITALVDGELPPAEREALERHLAECPRCREARAAEEAVAARLRAAGRPPLPAGFTASVMAKVGAAAPGSGRPRGRVLPLWPLFAAASAVAAAIVAMAWVGPGREGGAPPGIPMASKPRLYEREREGKVGLASEAPSPRGAAGAEDDDAARGPEVAAASKDGEAGEKRGKAVKEEGVGDRDGRAGGDAPAAPAGETAPGPAPDPATADRPSEDPKPGGAMPAPKGDAGAKKPSEEAKSRPGNLEGGKDAAAPAAKTADRLKAEAPAARAALFFESKSLGEGRQAVEGVLLAAREIAYRGGPWKSAGDVETEAGRLRRTLEGQQASNQRIATFPEDHVLELRLKPADLPRLQEMLAKASGLKAVPAASVLTGAGSGDVARALREELGRLDRFRADGGKAYRGPSGEVPAGGGAPPPVTQPPAPPPKRASPPPADAGGGTPAPAPKAEPPQEAVPPPKPSKEQLKTLETAPPEEREEPPPGEGGDIVVEIHVLVVPDRGGK
jgi:hypothetical protein